MVVSENGTQNGEGDAPAAPPQMPPQEPLPSMEEIVTKEVIENIVKAYDPDMELVTFTSVPGTQAGDNYMSIMYAVDIEIKSKKTGKTSPLNVMLKTMPRSAFRQQMINDCAAFIKDGRMYDTVFPEFIKFQKEQGLEDGEIYRGFPECYATFHDGKTDFIAMENLRIKGYKMGTRLEGLDFNHCEIIMKNMARFHAISYVKFRGDYDEIMKTYPFLEEKMFQTEEKINEMQKTWMGGTITKIAQLMRDMDHPKEGENVDLIYKDPSKFWRTINSLAGSKVPYAVVGHGDCWTNNFLFLYDENTGKPLGMKFVDFQLSRASSRAVDLSYFIFTSPSMSVLNEQKEELLRIYHAEFVNFTKKLGLPDELQQTFEEFMEEMDHFKFYGIVMGIMLLPIISANSVDVPDMDSFTGDITNTEETDKFFGDMMKSKVGEKKLLNLIKNHCVDVKFLHKD